MFAAIMKDIEPDLLLTIAERKAKYSQESEADHALRMRKYQEALAEYDRRAKKAFERLRVAVKTYCDNLIAQARTTADAVKDARLRELENEMLQ